MILHTDGAKAYKTKVPGLLHDAVVHQKKKRMVNGKPIWSKPIYSKLTVHKLENKQKVKVKSGTQIIDGFWKHLKKHIGNTSKTPGSQALARKIRSAQWLYWFKKENLWLKTGSMLSFLLDNKK